MPTINIFYDLMAFILVLGLILLCGQLAKKYNWAQMGIKLASRSNKRLRILEIQPIDTRHRLVLAQRDNVEYVLAVSAERITLLDKLPATISPALSSADSSEAHPS